MSRGLSSAVSAPGIPRAGVESLASAPVGIAPAAVTARRATPRAVLSGRAVGGFGCCVDRRGAQHVSRAADAMARVTTMKRAHHKGLRLGGHWFGNATKSPEAMSRTRASPRRELRADLTLSRRPEVDEAI